LRCSANRNWALALPYIILSSLLMVILVNTSTGNRKYWLTTEQTRKTPSVEMIHDQ
jgi:hypothetical protein